MPIPIILIHGIKDDARKMEPMARYLQAGGRTVYTVTLRPSFGQVGLEVLAEQLRDFVETNIDPAEKIDLVGFSMGGLVCRYYLQRLDGLSKVGSLITLGTPHHGTWTAYILQNIGSKQMRPKSEFLNDLNHDADTLKQVQCVSIWTPFDLIILPSTSSRISFGKNIRTWRLVHPGLVWSKKSMKIVETLLK